MKIIEVTENKKEYLDLLLLADEQENMVDCYLDNGRMYILDDNGVKSECVITGERNGVLEIKNIATVPEHQGKGYAKALIDFIIEKYSGQYAVLQVGTGDSPLTIPFYIFTSPSLLYQLAFHVCILDSTAGNFQEPYLPGFSTGFCSHRRGIKSIDITKTFGSRKARLNSTQLSR